MSISDWFNKKSKNNEKLKLEARRTLPVYPVLKAQSNKKSEQTSKKRQGTNTIQFLD